ncbi:MAG: hypothetical protein RBT46_01150 [Weeksellaceae bacterium]|jgi:hypothetical protein|nr:hypothetical protein [Weeksellaceae bacterium]MDX9704300.1 hypothetical protein [Weeksellaceae bacterium]
MAENKQFVATDEAKGKAKQLRLFALLAWLIAIAGEVFAILKLIKNETLVWLIVCIVVILALAVTGNLMWKKANRLDPASEKDKTRFFIQNQLGVIISVIAFLPLVILIFTNKEADGKTKGIAGAVAVIALLIAGISGIDFNPPSIEKYTEQINSQTSVIKDLTNGIDHVYWTPSGNKLHIFEDCQHIRNSSVSEGTVKDAWEARGIDDNEICKTCISRAEKAKTNDNQLLEIPEAEEAIMTE